MAKNDSKRIETLEEFIKWTKRFIYREYVFRGVSKHDDEIEASTYRRLKNEKGKFEKKEDETPEKLLEINRRMLEDARRQGHGTKDGVPLKDLDLLAELQHLGAATCLIDFTYNPLVALWMACRKSSRGASNGKVYAVGLNSQNTTFEEVTVEKAQKKNIDYFFTPDKDEVYKLYQWHPNYQNNRMRAQQSIFLFSGAPIASIADCIISSNSKQEIRDVLEQSVGMTEGSLFPDFEGFASQRAHNKRHVELDAQYYFHKGLEAEEKDNRELAAGYYTKGIPLTPDERLLYQLHYNRASCNDAIGKFNLAIKDYSKVIELKPNSAFLYYNRGIAKAELERYEDAIADFNEAIRLKIDNTFVYLDRGIAKAELERYEDAIADFNEAIRLNLSDADAYYNRGIAKAELERYEDAIADFNEAIRLNSNEVEMSMFRLEDLSTLQQVVAKVIIDIVVHNSSPGTYKFTFSDLYHQRESIQGHSNTQDIEAIIRDTVQTLRDEPGQFENDEEVRGGYKLTKGGLLFYLVREKRLQQELEKSMQALENAKLELNG